MRWSGPPRDVARLGLARALAWALWIGGWLVLGQLGTWAMPLWLGGMAPLSVWLAGVAMGLGIGRGVVLAGRTVRWVLLAAVCSTAAGLAWAGAGGGAPAALSTAAGWSVMCVMASRAVRLLRHPGVATPMVLPAALGAATAWLAWGDPVSSSGIAGAAGVLGVGALLAALLPACRRDAGCAAGMLGLGASGNPAPAGWITACAAATMVPMMASLAGMADTCATAGLASAAAVAGAHLVAMFLPALALQAAGRTLRAAAWLVLPMGAGVGLWALLPGAAGWLALSLCHAMAWSLVWATPRVRAASRPPGRWTLLWPAAAVTGLGLAQAQFGPLAAGVWLLVLGGLTVGAGGLAWGTRRHRAPWQRPRATACGSASAPVR